MSGVRIEKQGRRGRLRLDKARGNAIDEPLVRRADAGRAATWTRTRRARGARSSPPIPSCSAPASTWWACSSTTARAMQRFMLQFAEMVWGLYGLRKPMVAGVNGHAIAGGCILALTADHRVLRRGGAQIGLNEVRIGAAAALVRVRAAPGVGPARRARPGGPPRPQLRRRRGAPGRARRRARGCGGLRGLLPRCVSRSSSRRTPTRWAPPRSRCAPACCERMKAHERERMRSWLDAWFSEATRARMRELVAGLAKPRVTAGGARQSQTTTATVDDHRPIAASTRLASSTSRAPSPSSTPRKLPKPTSTAYQIADAAPAGTSARSGDMPTTPANGVTAARTPGRNRLTKMPEHAVALRRRARGPRSPPAASACGASRCSKNRRPCAPREEIHRRPTVRCWRASTTTPSSGRRRDAALGEEGPEDHGHVRGHRGEDVLERGETP